VSLSEGERRYLSYIRDTYADVELARVGEIVQEHLQPVRKALEDELRP
jgi:hypothetical protein